MCTIDREIGTDLVLSEFAKYYVNTYGLLWFPDCRVSDSKSVLTNNSFQGILFFFFFRLAVKNRIPIKLRVVKFARLAADQENMRVSRSHGRIDAITVYVYIYIYVDSAQNNRRRRRRWRFREFRFDRDRDSGETRVVKFITLRPRV